MTKGQAAIKTKYYALKKGRTSRKFVEVKELNARQKIERDEVLKRHRVEDLDLIQAYREDMGALDDEEEGELEALED